MRDVPSTLESAGDGRSLATREQARALRELFGVAILCNEHLLDDRDLREQADVRPFDLERVNQDNWKAATRYWGACLLRLGLSAETWDLMCTFLPSDSTRECYGLGQVAVAGLNFAWQIPINGDLTCMQWWTDWGNC